MPQNSINTHFLDVLDHFSYKNGPIDLVRGPFSNLETGTYFWPTCRCVHLFGSIWGCPNAPKQDEKLLSGCSGPFPLQECAYYSVRSLFSSLDIGTYIPSTCGPLSTFLVHSGVPKCLKTAQKTYFMAALHHFFLKNELIDMVRGLFSSSKAGSIWGYPNAPKQLKRNIFGLFHTISPTRTGLMIWLGAYFQA
jgi:hypothetical protein